MKTKFYFICFSLIVVSCNSDLNEEIPYYLDCLECMEMPRPDDSYNYKVYPGMEEWGSISTGEEKSNALQIPTSTLKKMSTQAIIQSIWEHPLLQGLLFYYNDQYQKDFESLFLKNNAYIELEKRKDAGEELLYRYNFIKPVSSNSPCLESKLFELMLSQSVFLSQLDVNSKRKIIEIAFIHDDEMQNQSTWSQLHRPITWLLIGRTLFTTDYAPFMEAVKSNAELEIFLNGWLPPAEVSDIDKENDLFNSAAQGVFYWQYQIDDIIIQDIINIGKRFLNE